MPDKKKLNINPHLALTHVSQNGAANGRNVALMLKTLDGLDEKTISMLESLIGEDLKHLTKTEGSPDNITQTNPTGEEMTEVQDLTKALEELTKTQESLKEALEQVELLKAQVDEFEQEGVEKEQARRLDLIMGVEKDEEKAKELLAALETLDAKAFDKVVAAMKSKVDVVEKSDLFKQMSQTTGEDGVDSLDSISQLEDMIKSQYKLNK